MRPESEPRCADCGHPHHAHVKWIRYADSDAPGTSRWFLEGTACQATITETRSHSLSQATVLHSWPCPCHEYKGGDAMRDTTSSSEES